MASKRKIIGKDGMFKFTTQKCSKRTCHLYGDPCCPQVRYRALDIPLTLWQRLMDDNNVVDIINSSQNTLAVTADGRAMVSYTLGLCIWSVRYRKFGMMGCCDSKASGMQGIDRYLPKHVFDASQDKSHNVLIGLPINNDGSLKTYGRINGVMLNCGGASSRYSPMISPEDFGTRIDALNQCLRDFGNPEADLMDWTKGMW